MTMAKNRWFSLRVILVICMTLFVTIVNVWLSVGQIGDIHSLLFAAAGVDRSVHQNGDASLEETQRLLETALVKANNTQMQMAAAEMARNHRQRFQNCRKSSSK
jgi:hypothetical protein